MPTGLERTCAVVLCGGLGRRLRKTVPDRPKPMALIGHSPFLDILLRYISASGIKKVVLCTGYMSEIIEAHYREPKYGLSIYISREKRPLGTGGAIKNAIPFITSDPFFVFNGDSLCRANISKMLAFHRSKNAVATVALSQANDKRSDIGRVILNSSNRILGFSEKNPKNQTGRVNAGIYILRSKVLSLIPERTKYSLETELFPKLSNCFGFKTRAPLMDIGVPKRYRKAVRILRTSGKKP